ncbi:DUF6308 family protein [Streptomyces sp. AP-93]|uniref:DUF6308 family protein n=1 Tax=Streptomyces sp. AP-93 TaxID=2929048 RepID=UPI001FAF9BF0|nr:DUF6308 family protein [Streptomyces sp. AP-93]MCJ0869696.1 DUF6308 family protein [Streptomyces sp. AP-93]
MASVGFTERLRALLSTADAAADLRRYFDDGLEGGTPAFTGSRFEHLDGGGDRADIADIVTAADLMAVQMLSVQVPPRAALALLEGPLAGELSVLLGQIPADVDMGHAEPALLGPGSPADRAWHLLTGQRGLGWVTANKLLARKRPRLLPVYDQVVRCAVAEPASFWLSLRDALAADGKALHEQLLSLRDDAEVPETVSALRICDVVLWMSHVTDHKEKGCSGKPA